MAQQLTCEELKKHPEYPYVVWDLKPTEKGSLAAGKGRGGPYKIAYEVHGHGPTHLVFIMGLGSLMSAWQRQTKDFGHTQGETYSVLILDNIGMGESDKPFRRYSTSGMARDLLEVLEYLKWVEQERSLHIVGISMGGMIAQELAVLIPTKIASLNLISTASQLVNTVGFFENLQQRAALFIPKSLDATVAGTKQRLYSPDYIMSPDDTESLVQPFATCGDRAAANELRKRTDSGDAFTRTGFIAQAIAAGWHRKSAEQLAEITRSVGRERILVVHGTGDQMITVPHAKVLIAGLSAGGDEVKNVIWEGQGHVIPIEKRKEFNTLLKEQFDKWSLKK